MAESMVSVVIGLAILVFAAILLTHQIRRERRREKPMGHFDGRRLWDRMRHRH